MKVRNGIEVYIRDVPNSKFKELKMKFEIEGDCLCELVSILQNIQSYTNWNYKCVSASHINRVSNFESYNYYLFDFPWPLDDRELITHTTMQQDSISRVIKLRNKGLNSHPEIEDNEKNTRVLDHINVWVITPKEGKIQIEYLLRSSPGGQVAAWVYNTAIDMGPIKTMEALKEIVKSGEYRDQELSWILH